MQKRRPVRIPAKKRHVRLKVVGWALGSAALALFVLPYWLNTRLPLPRPLGLHAGGRPLPLDPAGARLLVDRTAYDTNTAQRVIRQEIFDACLELVRGAETFVLADFFLWNGWQGRTPELHRRLSSEFADALIARKREKPDLTVLVLTDPINRLYGAQEEPFYARLASNGVLVAFTDLDALRESNVVYGPPARVYGPVLRRVPGLSRWLGRPRLANPFEPGGAPVEPVQMGRLLQFKANHRKLLVADAADGDLRLVVTSFNPADGSSAHSNVGVLLAGDIAAEAARAELAALAWSASSPARRLPADPAAWDAAVRRISARLPPAVAPAELDATGPTAEWCTEGAIRERVLELLDNAWSGDEIRIAMFYLSDRDVVRTIQDAALAGARVRLILDPNRDAFGRTKNGVPNRPVAAELVAFAARQDVDLAVRWADTHGEQFHPKAMSIVNTPRGKCQLLCGSANWTRRNLADYNLEADVLLVNDVAVTEAFNRSFDAAWGNADGLRCTVAYDAFAEQGSALWFKTFLYRVQEASGLCTF